MGRYCSYLLLKQDGGTSQIQVNKTLCQTTRVTLYITLSMKSFVHKEISSYPVLVERYGDVDELGRDESPNPNDVGSLVDQEISLVVSFSVEICVTLSGVFHVVC